MIFLEFMGWLTAILLISGFIYMLVDAYEREKLISKGVFFQEEDYRHYEESTERSRIYELGVMKGFHTKAPACHKCGMPWNGEYCDHE